MLFTRENNMIQTNNNVKEINKFYVVKIHLVHKIEFKIKSTSTWLQLSITWLIK